MAGKCCPKPKAERSRKSAEPGAGISLVHQANHLIDQQLRRLKQDFLKEGGLRERMTRT
ncbi:MAG: four helix bundle suffix domain-containing protein [Verrucomicrobiota bacterium]